MVELHQLVEGGEELVPHVVLITAVLQHLEMLNMVPITAKLMERQWNFTKVSYLKRAVMAKCARSCIIIGIYTYQSIIKDVSEFWWRAQCRCSQTKEKKVRQQRGMIKNIYQERKKHWRCLYFLSYFIFICVYLSCVPPGQDKCCDNRKTDKELHKATKDKPTLNNLKQYNQ